jgi:hypothetical protein
MFFHAGTSSWGQGAEIEMRTVSNTLTQPTGEKVKVVIEAVERYEA